MTPLTVLRRAAMTVAVLASLLVPRARAAETINQVDDADAMFTYAGLNPAADATAYLGTLHQRGGGTTSGETLTFQFTGHKAEFYGIRGPNWGDCEIYVDDMTTPATVDVRGVMTTVVSNWNAARINQTLLCTWSDPSAADLPHTVRLRRLGTNVLNGNSGTRSISFDYVMLYTGGGVVAPTALALNKAATTILEGGSETLVPLFTPPEATNQDVTWTTTNAAVATVSSAGVVSGVAVGTATVRATSVAVPTLFADCIVTVNPVAPTSVSIINPLRGLLYPGQTAKLLGTVAPAKASQSLNWTSSNPAVATVDAIGLVTAVQPGTTTIAAASAGSPGVAAAVTVEILTIPEVAPTVPQSPSAAALHWRYEQADPADQFVESITTQVYFWHRSGSDFNHDIYFDRFEELKAMVAELGVRYIRGRPESGAASMMTDVYATTGARFSVTNAVDGSGSNASITSYQNLIRSLGAAVKYIEGPNEQDGNLFQYNGLQDTATDFPALAAYQHALYDAVKAMPETALYDWKIAGPSPGDPAVVQRFTELMWQYSDFPTIHSYTSGRMPTHNLDSANYGAVELGLPAGVQRRIAATEAGVTNAVRSTAQQPGVSEVASAKYIPRQHFEYFNRGMVYIPTFELYDRAVGDNKLTVQNGNWGLIRNTGSPKPAFNTVRDILHLLADPGVNFIPSKLRFALSGDTTEIHHTLLQKSDGRYILALWKDAESFDNADRVNGTDLTPAPVPVGVHLAAAAATVKIYAPFFTDRPGNGATPKGQIPVATYAGVDRFTLNVSDHVVLVEIAPATASTLGLTSLPYRTPLPERTVYEAEALPRAIAGGTVATPVSIRARSGAYVELRTASPGSYIEFDVAVPHAGNYRVAAGNLGQLSNGIHQFSVDGQNVGGLVDQISFSSTGVGALIHEIAYGDYYFTTPGVKKFRFTVAGKNPAATDHDIAVDYVLLTYLPPSPAGVMLGNLVRTYDGMPKPVDVATDPAGLPVAVAYNGNSTAPTNAGTYAVTAIVADPDHNFEGSATGTLTINPAAAGIAISGVNPDTGIISRPYDGSAQTVEIVTSPAGLGTVVTYGGSLTPPTLPGTYVVTVTANDPNYTGSVTALLRIGITALVRHAPTVNSDIDGSIQMLLPEPIALNGGSYIAGDLLVPGSPECRLNGHPLLGAVVEGPGAAEPSNYKITLNGNALLSRLIRRVDAIPLPAVGAPPSPLGSRDVALNNASQSPGDFATLRNLTLNGNTGVVSVPPGTYGRLTANAGNGFALGVAGATAPAVYNLQGLTLNANARIVLAGPAILRIGSSVTVDGTVNAAGPAASLTIEISNGGLTLNGAATINGSVLAPVGTVTLNGTSVLAGDVSCDGLVLNGNSVLRDPEQ